MKLPPLLPEETYHRVLRVAYLDGLSVLAVAGLLALAAASMRDVPNTGIGMLVAAAGAIELHGVSLLRAGASRGMKWVIASQPYLWFVLISYCMVQLTIRDLEPLRDAIKIGAPGGLAAQGITEEQFATLVYTPMYVALAVGTTLLQGGMTLYYWRRRQAVVAALEEEE
ncbi:hypothetical protein [Opitutus terrae]|uniref:Uncharacterized protein n=1 Tax=Opitutus terrae (strain DSM 11246 / JCM 15787 / PB90-1) TaxID=452637 RepID=B1ZWH6_OPITP|nr:hypothetical protein [Opitutus terrae]ACB73300.1 hypothetical protein Oter_0008 [Opitutus terrae PB90-1]